MTPPRTLRWSQHGPAFSVPPSRWFGRAPCAPHVRIPVQSERAQTELMSAACNGDADEIQPRKDTMKTIKRIALTLFPIAAASLLQCFGAEPRVVTVDSTAPASRMLESFRELSGLELTIASNVTNASRLPITMEVSQGKRLESAEAVRLMEREMREQAGIIITRLDDKRASVTYNDALPTKPGDLPLLGRIVRYKLEAPPGVARP